MQVRSVENLNAEVTKNAVPYVATVNQYNAMSLNQVTQVFKIGAAGHFKHWQLGLAVTLPGIKIWGEGKLDKSFEAYNLNKNPVDTNIPAQKYPEFIISDLQRGLQSHYKIPLSATAGLKLIYPKFALSASFEYFLGYKNRTILQGQDRTAIRPTAFYGNDTIHGFMQIQTSANHVLNIGLGAEVKVQPKWTLLLGFRTDFSNRTDYLPNNSVVNAPSAGSPTWHYLYFSSGFTYRLAYHNLTLGIDYGVAVSANKQQIYNFTEPQQDNFLLGALHQNMRASVHKPNLILTYIYFLKTKGKRTVTMSILDELKKAQIKKEKPTRKKKK
ncbi:MAG: hypothetical protein IPP77_12215 [Bacteroidetes bacterium]|nr:hypothetical protein [Bacteroidota bacterium]